MPGGSVTLRTDVSQFYSSIYTHAVDWAIRGKLRAKRAIRAKTLGAELDKLLRTSRDGQTVGLSIGPDTSWIVSELILARVDEALCKKHPSVHKRAVRFVDDMTFYASSVGEAHDVLSAYERILADFELSLNPVKVRIADGLEPAEPEWVSRLRQMRFRADKDEHLTNDMVDLFSSAFDAARKFPTDGVLSYAIKRCDPFPAGVRSWPVYRDLVLATITQEPSTLRHVYQVLVFARRHGLDVKTDRLVEVLNQSCAEHARLDHGFEVSWILTILRELDLPLDRAVARNIAHMEDNSSLILLADMVEERRPLKTVDLDLAVRRAERADALSTSDWLLAYEFRAARWCSPKAWDHIPQWRELYRAKVRLLLSKAISGRRMRLRRMKPAFLPGWTYP